MPKYPAVNDPASSDGAGPRETFKAPPTDAQRADEAILTYARKRPVVKAR